MKTVRRRREWVLLFHFHNVPLGHIAAILEIPPDTVRGDISADYRRPNGSAWPFDQSDAAAAAARPINGQTARKVRRMTELEPRYTPARIAELLLLDLGRVQSYTARIRRLRPVRGDRRKPGELIRPRTPAEQADAWRAYDRERKRRKKRELAMPQPGWSYADRSAAARAEAAARAAFQAAVKEGRLSAGALLDLAAGLYFAPPRTAPPEPARWSGASSWQADRRKPEDLPAIDIAGRPASALDPNSKLDWDKVGELRRLRAQGWRTKDLAARYGIHHSMVRAILRGVYWVPPSPPLPPEGLIVAHVGEPPYMQANPLKIGVFEQ